jgi:hypothetical protein
VFVALAPVIFLGHMSVPILVDLTKLPSFLYESVLGTAGLIKNLRIRTFLVCPSGKKAFLASASDVDKLLPVLCTFTPSECENVLCYLCGCENLRNINDVRKSERLIGEFFECLCQSLVPLYLEHFPAGTSVQNMIHYIQS